MTSGRRYLLLQASIGGLSFLVLIQGYELATGARISFAVKVAVALLVAVGVTALTRVYGPPTAGRNGRA